MAIYPDGAHWPALHELVDRVVERQRADWPVGQHGARRQLGHRLRPLGTPPSRKAWRRSSRRWSAQRRRLHRCPSQRHGWIVDPLDGTTTLGGPADLGDFDGASTGRPAPRGDHRCAPLHQRYVAVRGQGVWRNGEPLQLPGGPRHRCNCASLCTRSPPVLQKVPHAFPPKRECWVLPASTCWVWA